MLVLASHLPASVLSPSQATAPLCCTRLTTARDPAEIAPRLCQNGTLPRLPSCCREHLSGPTHLHAPLITRARDASTPHPPPGGFEWGSTTLLRGVDPLSLTNFELTSCHNVVFASVGGRLFRSLDGGRSHVELPNSVGIVKMVAVCTGGLMPGALSAAASATEACAGSPESVRG